MDYLGVFSIHVASDDIPVRGLCVSFFVGTIVIVDLK